jgi:hypothetical protein
MYIKNKSPYQQSLTKAHLLSLIPDPLSLPDFVVQVDDEVLDEFSLCLVSE